MTDREPVRFIREPVVAQVRPPLICVRCGGGVPDLRPLSDLGNRSPAQVHTDWHERQDQ